MQASAHISLAFLLYDSQSSNIFVGENESSHLHLPSLEVQWFIALACCCTGLVAGRCEVQAAGAELMHLRGRSSWAMEVQTLMDLDSQPDLNAASCFLVTGTNTEVLTGVDSCRRCTEALHRA